MLVPCSPHKQKCIPYFGIHPFKGETTLSGGSKNPQINEPIGESIGEMGEEKDIENIFKRNGLWTECER